MAKATTLQEKFTKDILPQLRKELGVKNINAVPRMLKVKINVGIGKMVGDGGKDYSEVVNNVTAISGQKPVVTKSKKAISNFKLREGMPVGVVVTLRGKRMYDFINKLVNITFPRVRDFRGISRKGFDGNGNYSVAIREHTVFPEINADDIAKLHGVQVTVVTNAKTDEHGLALLTALGFPFKKDEK